MHSISQVFVTIAVVSGAVLGSGVVTGCATPVDEEEMALTNSALGPPTDPSTVPADCLGYFEREPQSDRGQRFFGKKVCGEISAGDRDQFEFQADDGFWVRVEAESPVTMELDGKCVRRQVATGSYARLRLAPTKKNDKCTIRVRITSDTTQIYRLYRDG